METQERARARGKIVSVLFYICIVCIESEHSNKNEGTIYALTAQKCCAENLIFIHEHEFNGIVWQMWMGSGKSTIRKQCGLNMHITPSHTHILCFV